MLLQAKGSDLGEVKVLPHLCIRSGNCHKEQAKTGTASEWRETPSHVELHTGAHSNRPAILPSLPPLETGETETHVSSLWAQNVQAAA